MSPLYLAARLVGAGMTAPGVYVPFICMNAMLIYSINIIQEGIHVLWLVIKCESESR